VKLSRTFLLAASFALCAARPVAAQIHVLEPEDPNRERRAYTAKIMREFNGIMNEWRTAWNANDAKAVSQFYTTDAALLLATTDTATRGQKQIESALSRVLLCSGGIQTGVEDFRVNGELAYALGRYHLAGASGKEPRSGTFMMLLENHGRRWLIRSHIFRPDGAVRTGAPECPAPDQADAPQL
jgi:uncharacterized protein (TIGR02246 family)